MKTFETQLSYRIWLIQRTLRQPNASLNILLNVSKEGQKSFCKAWGEDLGLHESIIKLDEVTTVQQAEEKTKQNKTGLMLF